MLYREAAKSGPVTKREGKGGKGLGTKKNRSKKNPKKMWPLSSRGEGKALVAGPLKNTLFTGSHIQIYEITSINVQLLCCSLKYVYM